MTPIDNVTKFIALTALLAVILITTTSLLHAQRRGKNTKLKSGSAQTKLWQQVKESNLRPLAERTGLPEKYLVFNLNQPLLESMFAESKLANTSAVLGKDFVMDVPMPDGSLQRFRMEETQLLSAELKQQHPDWKFYTGHGIDDPQATGRFDWNALGFHGYISTSDKGTVVIDPYKKGDKSNYLVFYKHEYGKSNNQFYCSVEDKMTKADGFAVPSAVSPSTPNFSFGATVRTYRIAIATTGEWSRNAAGFNASTNPLTAQQIRDGALAVVSTSVNRLNGVYERELASRFMLVNPVTTDDNTNIIFDNPDTDPYNNTDQAEDKPGEINQLRVNRETINTRRGEPNYDIGHLYGTGGGGVASSPSLCGAAKAEGYSARGTQTGDPFVVDYVAHEIGHQFGSDHTYNNVDTPNTGACPLSSYSAMNAYEPGSGSTIMSYVGICGARNLQQNVDFGTPAFHIRSLTVINENITTGAPQQNNCGVVSTTTNNVPTVNAGAAFTIPRLTPFTLTATGTDADAGDVANLLYSWEEYDLAQQPSGPAGNPANTYDVDTDNVQRPLFRVYSPTASNSRTFPSLTFILNPAGNDTSADVNSVRGNQPPLEYTGTHPTGLPGAVCEANKTCVIGERLPTINRMMAFRVALRDRRGGVADAPTTVTIAAGAGPFQITAQNASPTSWQGSTQQTVTWDVAGTTANGVNTANVNILLSTDGGQTFPVMLAANTPNDGTEPITVPNNPTTTARIKVEAVGNIFFDINNINFTITAAAPMVAVSDAQVNEGGTATPSQNKGQIGVKGGSIMNFAPFVIRLSQASTQPITINVETADGTARVADGDYTTTLSGDVTGTTVTFAPGDIEQTVNVEILDDPNPEPDETFFFNISNASNATIGDAQGVGTISQNDGFTTASEVTITGRVTLGGNLPLSGVTVALSGELQETKITDADGYYQFTVPAGRFYIVSVSRAGYVFTPSRHEFGGSITTNQSADFTSTGRKGRIRSRLRARF